MRTIILLCMIACLFSCKKDNGMLNEINNDIVGTWEYAGFSGYPFTSQPEPPGNGKIIVFNKSGSFERKLHDSLIFKGTYSLRFKKDCHERETDIILKTTEQSSSFYQYVEIVDGRLTLSTPNCWEDGGTGSYRRIN